MTVTRRTFVALLAGAAITSLSLDPPRVRRPPSQPARARTEEETARAVATWITNIDPVVWSRLTADLVALSAKEQERLAGMTAWRVRLAQARVDLEQEARATMLIRFDEASGTWS